MSRPNPLVRVGFLTLAATLAAACVAVASAQDSPPSAGDAKTVTVKQGDLVLKLDREGRIDSASHIKVRLIPQAFGGAFEVDEVLKRGGPVRKGEVILKLDGKAIQKELESARMGLDHAQRNMQIALQEAQVLKEGNAQRLEQVAKGREQTQKELEIWEKFDGPDMLKGQALSMQSGENRLADQKQELSQLESMYNGTHLAKETKDIVLDRTRRDVSISEQWLKLSHNDNTVAETYRYPQRDTQVRDAVRWALADEAHAKVGVAASEERKKMELEAAQKGLQDAKERVEKLEADAALLTVSAPADGVMTPITLEPRDIIGARQTICEVLDPNKLQVVFNAAATDLRLLNQGSDLRVSLPEFPEVKLGGHVQEIAPIGAQGDGGTNFPVTVALSGESPLLRIGLRCKLATARTLANVVNVPSEAVKWEDGQPFCMVKAGDKSQRRAVTLGASADKAVVVASGLAPGDVLVLEEATK